MFKTEVPTEGIEEKFHKMTQGKIGKLAFELAEETAKNLTMDENNYIDMEEKLNHIVEMCTQLTAGEKRLSYKDILDSTFFKTKLFLVYI